MYVNIGIRNHEGILKRVSHCGIAIKIGPMFALIQVKDWFMFFLFSKISFSLQKAEYLKKNKKE